MTTMAHRRLGLVTKGSHNQFGQDTLLGPHLCLVMQGGGGHWRSFKASPSLEMAGAAKPWEQEGGMNGGASCHKRTAVEFIALKCP